jgi:hypothetical protein
MPYLVQAKGSGSVTIGFKANVGGYGWAIIVPAAVKLDVTVRKRIEHLITLILASLSSSTTPLLTLSASPDLHLLVVQTRPRHALVDQVQVLHGAVLVDGGDL